MANVFCFLKNIENSRYKSYLPNQTLTFIENPESEASEILTKQIPEIEEARSFLEVLSIDRDAKTKYEMLHKKH